MIKIARLQVRNYRGIKSLDQAIPAAGAIAKGRNGSGKTSVLNAIGAALAASDIGPDAVRIGEADGEILIDLDAAGRALQVRRRFSASGSILDVKNDEGDKKAKPATLLANLLGSAPLDVVGLVLEKDKRKRRELVLAAVPLRVTVEQLRRWVPQLPEDFDTSGHALEVLERLRSAAYAKRTIANKALDAAAAAVASAAGDVNAHLGALEELGADVHDLDPEAVADLISARREAEALEARAARAAEQETRTASIRAAIADLRASAERDRETAEFAPSEAEWRQATAALQPARENVRAAEEALKRAREALAEATNRVQSIEAVKTIAERDLERAAERDAEAERLEATLAATLDTVDAEELDQARGRVAAAIGRELRQRRRVLAAAAQQAHEDATRAYDDARGTADHLDAVVQALTKEAPAAILAEAPGIPAGLELAGDEVRLAGVSLDHLCGAEQMRFAADIARALHPGVGFLVVDGLERLDPEQLDAFVEHATSDGRQLLGSIVDRGELVLAAIEKGGA